jgi:hypothetical protein
MFKTICIDDSNRPNEIPVGYWVIKENFYNITRVFKMVNQGNILGVELKEINLENLKNCPYNCFKLSRFAINLNDLDKFIEFCKSCGELDEFSNTELKELLEEQLEFDIN